jgi:transformation/transcription domain-associated protein
MEDGNTMLIHWTKKILLEEGHSLSQLMHILQLIVRHWKVSKSFTFILKFREAYFCLYELVFVLLSYQVYYPVRLQLITHMVTAIQRLGFAPTSTFEHRKLAVELAEVIIKWELERIKNEGTDVTIDLKPLLGNAGKVTDSKSIERNHTDQVVNFLLRVACQVNEPTPTPGAQGEMLSKRCVTLIKTVLKPDVWPCCDLKVAWFDKLLTSLDSPQTNFPNICTGLELLTFIISVLTKEQTLDHFKGLQKGIAACMICQNSKVERNDLKK